MYTEIIRAENALTRHHIPKFVFELNDEGYILEGAYSYYINDYIAIGGNLGFSMGYGSEKTEFNGPGGQISSVNSHSDDVRFRFTPNIKFVTPRIYRWEEHDLDFSIYVNPGVIISPGMNKSHNANIFNLNIQSGLEIKYLNWIFDIAYDISNFSIYSGTSIKHKKLNQGMVLGIGVIL